MIVLTTHRPEAYAHHGVAPERFVSAPTLAVDLCADTNAKMVGARSFVSAPRSAVGVCADTNWSKR